MLQVDHITNGVDTNQNNYINSRTKNFDKVGNPRHHKTFLIVHFTGQKEPKNLEQIRTISILGYINDLIYKHNTSIP